MALAQTHVSLRCLHKNCRVLRVLKRYSSDTPCRTRTSLQFVPSRKVKLADSDDEMVKSLKWMLKLGLVRQSCPGVYHLLPLALRSLEKLVALIDSEMKAIGAAKMAMPILTPAVLWKKTGRWDSVGAELMRLKDQNEAEYCLGPTHEEPITQLVAEEQLSYRQLPLRLYQLDRKFRDEKRPRFGLLRCREFWMKDMYSFDESSEAAQETYSAVCHAYEKILQRLRLPVIKVRADSGTIGGSLSHEYHIPYYRGEDTLVICQKCDGGVSQELLGSIEGEELKRLPDCQLSSKDCSLSKTKGIEVAHAFYLGTKYSEPFNATFIDNVGQKKLLEMGCFGIGVSRLLAAALEHGLSDQEGRLIWPPAIAPYHICVACLAQNADDTAVQRSEQLYDQLSKLYPGEVILEDRVYLTLGRRIRICEELGYPVMVLVGHKAPDGMFELRVQSNIGSRITEQQVTWETHMVQEQEMLQLIETSFMQR